MEPIMDGAPSAHSLAGRGTRRLVDGPRIELRVGEERRPFCARNRILCQSGRFWRGCLLEHVAVPSGGTLEHVSAPDHMLFFVAAGSCDIRYRAGGPETRCRLSPGSFCIVSRGYRFERIAWKASRAEAIVVEFRDTDAEADPIDAFGRTDALFDVCMGVEDAYVASLLGLMRHEIESGCPTGTAYSQALSLALASRIAALWASAPVVDRHVAPLSTEHLSRITEHIATNLADTLTIERLAAVANMSPFHFARRFKQATGITPHQFVTRERILRARELLVSTRQSIREIAVSLGFASQSHFTDVYRSITGNTPRRDRSGF
jgi:AraC family transcriptional regulator